MENKTKWYRDPDVITKIIAVAFLVLLGCCIHFFAQDFFDKTLKLAISGNVNALAEYLRSFGPWAIVFRDGIAPVFFLQFFFRRLMV